jgi:DNA repair protein RecO (recombination protein O)
LKLQRVEGIVLRTKPFSETSLVGALFTRQLGKIGVIARGARRPGRMAAAAFQPTNIITCSVYLHERSGLRTISNLELEAVHESIPHVPQVFGLAGYALELVISQVPDEDPAPRVFSLLKGFLGALNAGSLRDAERVVLTFELRLQRALGYGLRTDACPRCGGPVGASRALSLRGGGIVCAACAPRDACQETVCEEDLAALRAMLAEPDAQWARQVVSPETTARLVRIARNAWEMHAPVPVRSSSLSFLAELRGGAYGERSTVRSPSPTGIPDQSASNDRA